ncbi:MAG: PLP-dependent transferase [Gemmatimonadales bacterium]
MTRLPEQHTTHQLATLAVHAGQHPDPVAGAVMPPIYQTSTYVQDALGVPHNGYEYARTANPTREALERNLAALEGGTHGFAFGSGLAALDTVLKLLKSGDHVIVGSNVYGGISPPDAARLRATSGSPSPSSTCATSRTSRRRSGPRRGCCTARRRPTR